MSNPEKLIIGRTDKIDFPKFRLEDIAVKIDTGAYTSCLHCSSVEVVSIEGTPTLKFQLFDARHPGIAEHYYYHAPFNQKEIKSSFGNVELRYAILTDVILFGRTYTTEFTLSKRDGLKYPVLLGRKFLKFRFIVDVDQRELSYADKHSNLNSNQL